MSKSYLICARGGLNETSPHRLTYVNAWSAIVGTAWEGLIGVALLKEVCC